MFEIGVYFDPSIRLKSSSSRAILQPSHLKKILASQKKKIDLASKSQGVKTGYELHLGFGPTNFSN